MSYDGNNRRSGEDRRSGQDRREMLDSSHPGAHSDMRGSVIDRRENGGRRSTDLITVDELERMR